jgi:predicted O-methyltransferase YrrM
MNAKLYALKTAMQVRGMLDEEQIAYLYDLAQLAPDGAACEVGVWRGRSFVGWGLGRKGQLYAVDWWYGGADIAEQLEAKEMAGDSPAVIGAKRKRDFEATIAALGLAERTIIVVGYSWYAATQILEPLAFCFVDACHDQEAVNKDLMAWPQKIMPGGILAMHDYGTHKCPGVKIEVDAWQKLAQWEPLKVVGSTIAFRRPAS